MNNYDPLILDFGTDCLRVQSQSGDIPLHVFPNAMGKQVIGFDGALSQQWSGNELFCDQILGRRGYLDVIYPVVGGLLRDRATEEKLLNYVFNERMKIKDWERRPVLVTEAGTGVNDQRKFFYELFFDKYKCPAVGFLPQSLASFFARGRGTGVIVHSGAGFTHILPVIDNCVVESASYEVKLAGNNVTERLMDLLRVRGYNLHRSSDFGIATVLKEKFCYVSTNIKRDRKIADETTAHNISYFIGNNIEFQFGPERFEAPELLFDPHVASIEADGIGYGVFKSISASPVHCRKELYRNIVISGGSSLLPGFDVRLQTDVSDIVRREVTKDLDDKDNQRVKVYVEAPQNRKNLVLEGSKMFSESFMNDKSNKDTRVVWADYYREKGADRCIMEINRGKHIYAQR